ncbi:MAG: hypothetical protein ACR2LK_04795 [Solirubrobacteraceae bacterium]
MHRHELRVLAVATLRVTWRTYTPRSLSAGDDVDRALVARENPDRIRLDAGLEPAAHMLCGAVELVGERGDGYSLRRRAAAS